MNVVESSEIDRDRSTLAVLENRLQQCEKTKKRIDSLNSQLDELVKTAAMTGDGVLRRLDELEKLYSRKPQSSSSNATTRTPGTKTMMEKFLDLSLQNSSYISQMSLPKEESCKAGSDKKNYGCRDVFYGVATQMDQLKEAADALEQLSMNPVLQGYGLRDEAMQMREDLSTLFNKLMKKAKDLREAEKMCICCGKCG